jgi:8-oxo-dGTP pyrophosphatase MutT (NUDIX family)
MKRYSCVTLFDEGLEHVLLIHKLRPDWQAHKANFPGGKVEDADMPHVDGCQFQFPSRGCCRTTTEADELAFMNAAKREIREEAGIDATQLQHYCTLQYQVNGVDGECRFYCGVAPISKAKTIEQERIFVAAVDDVLDGQVIDDQAYTLPTMDNLPWLVAMARLKLRTDVSWRPSYVVKELP